MSRGPVATWPLAATAVVAALAFAAAGCGSAGHQDERQGAGGGAGHDAAPGREETPMTDFKLASSAFAEGDTIPKHHTCDAADISPPLAWTGAPAGTVSFALLCADPDAPRGNWVHWVLFDIDSTVTSLGAGLPSTAAVAGGARHGKNDFGQLGYGGPCPPRGPAHRYVFQLLALDCRLGLGSGATMKEVFAAAEGHILGRTELMGRYGR